MKHRMLIAGLVLTTLALTTVANAQGRSSGARNSNAHRPSTIQQIDMMSMRQQAEMRRQEAEARRQAADARRLEAEQRRAEAEANNRSEDAQAEHPPNEHAAIEAFAAEGNAENQNLRDERPDLRGDNRDGHGEDNPPTED